MYEAKIRSKILMQVLSNKSNEYINVIMFYYFLSPDLDEIMQYRNKNINFVYQLLLSLWKKINRRTQHRSAETKNHESNNESKIGQWKLKSSKNNITKA